VATDRRPAKLPANADRRRRVASQGVDATGRRPVDRDRPQATPLPDVQGDAGDGPLEGPARQAGRAVHVARHGKVRERALLAGYDGEYYHSNAYRDRYDVFTRYSNNYNRLHVSRLLTRVFL